MLELRSTPVDAEERHARTQSIHEDRRVSIREILTPEQQARYDQLASDRAGTPSAVFVLGPSGGPEAVPITVGISDGNATEVVSGDLAEGQQVIVGVAATPEGPGRAPGLGVLGNLRLRL